MRILAAQVEVPAVTTARERDAWVSELCGRLSSSLKEEAADLVVLPELATIDYSLASFGELAELAETLDGPSMQAFGALARETGAWVTFGMPRADGNTFRISQIFVGPEGELRGHYDKLHLVGFGEIRETRFFSPGDHLAVFEIAGMRVAPVICYDFRFSGLFDRLCRDLGAELVLHPVAFARDDTFESWHAFAVARALEWQVHFLSLNRAGTNFGRSIYVPPWVDQATSATVFADEESLRRLDIARTAIDESRRNRPLQTDRRRDYSKILTD
jgi:nitrilase